MTALPPEADMLIVGINVCYVPLADYAAPFARPCSCLKCRASENFKHDQR